jgi:hypothetical protein
LFNVELSTVTGILNKPGLERRIASLHRTMLSFGNIKSRASARDSSTATPKITCG